LLSEETLTGDNPGMSEHRFQIGQTVVVSAYGAPPGPYSITRLLPADQGEPNYRGKSLVDDHERAMSENAIRLLQAKFEPGSVQPPKKRTASTR
jgi:hypothetical protein